jgi:hypothetical protein
LSGRTRLYRRPPEHLFNSPPPKNKGAEALSASTPQDFRSSDGLAPVADAVVVVNGANAMAVMGGGLDGSGAQHGQGDGGGDQLVHGAVLRSWNQAMLAP